MDDPFMGPAPRDLRGPWFVAGYGGECDNCFDAFNEGDNIRADGSDGYLCEECGDDDE